VSTDLIDKVRVEIEKTGFPLELRVAALLQAREYYVAHSVYFVDRDEQKGRELDLRALKNAFFRNDGLDYAVRHCLLIECKRSASRPWVVFTSPSVSYDQNISDIQCAGANGLPWLRSNWKQLRELEARHPWFSLLQRGRAFFEPFSGGGEANQGIFKALVSVVKALVAIREAGFGGGPDQPRNIGFYYPMVVLDGSLFVARLESSGLVVEEATAIPVSINYRSPHYAEEERYTVLIVQESVLEREIAQLDTWLQEAAEYLQEHTDRFIPEKRKRLSRAGSAAANKQMQRSAPRRRR
jgi:hypothetical protein